MTKNPDSIPYNIWPAEVLRLTKREAADSLGLTLFELMQRAGEATFQLASRVYPASAHWLILCGHGNNGGDGYVVARLAQAVGRRVTLLTVESDSPLPEEAQAAREAWLNTGDVIHAATIPRPDDISLTIDGLLSADLRSTSRDPVATPIHRANHHPAPVVALDIPSGLSAQTDATPGAVVQADHTLTFIAFKSGLLTGETRDVVGHLHHHALGLERWPAGQSIPLTRFCAAHFADWLPSRRATSHKGDHGKLVIVGSDRGTADAIRICGEVALRSGAGLVRVPTHPENVAPIVTVRPELMVDELTSQTLKAVLEWADVVAIGPSLGQRGWGRSTLRTVESFNKPMVWDTDALNLLALNPDKRHNRALTPHPGEAARLPNVSVAETESDCLFSAQRLVKRYGGVVVLKGAGTVVASESGAMGIIDAGNAGMISGGMGDALTGIIAALSGQHLTPYDAAYTGCVAHGDAADRLAARESTRGILATDLFSMLRRAVNPDVIDVDHD